MAAEKVELRSVSRALLVMAYETHKQRYE